MEEEFTNYFGKADNVTLSKGIILAEDNECGDEYNLFYWCYLLPSLTNGHTKVIGECGFDTTYEKSTFEFTYNEKEDCVYYNKDYRTVIVENETYNKYKKYIQSDKDLTDNALPWIRFPRTKDGIAIPVLIEKIFGKIPNMKFTCNNF